VALSYVRITSPPRLLLLIATSGRTCWIGTRPPVLEAYVGLDHVIVAEEATYSFADSGLLDELALEAGVR